MRLAFWRHEPAAPQWLSIDRAAPYALAMEMATWPEPIDVIRDACGLPPRFAVAVGRAWHAVLSAAAVQAPYQQFVVAYWRPIEHPTREIVLSTHHPAPSGWRGRRGGRPIGPYR